MPYRTTRDLPESVRDHLSEHARDIDRVAYNRAWVEYQHDEERAHRVAWAAVKRRYEKDERTGRWHRTPGPPSR